MTVRELIEVCEDEMLISLAKMTTLYGQEHKVIVFVAHKKSLMQDMYENGINFAEVASEEVKTISALVARSVTLEIIF